jgi:metacaspase-1
VFIYGFFSTVGLVDNLHQGIRLAAAARSLIQGGFSMQKMNDAKQLLAGAQSLFHGLAHRNEPIQEGLGEEKFVENWNTEGRDVWMFSGAK